MATSISTPRWTGRRQRIRNLRCRTCQRECSERTGTPWYHSHWREETALAVARHLAEGDGIRKTARLVGVDQNTVMRWNRLLGARGQALHHERVRHVRVREAQGDEMWSFVEKKEARCDRTEVADEGQGSPWDHTVVDAQMKLAVSLVIGPAARRTPRRSAMHSARVLVARWLCLCSASQDLRS